MAGALRAGNLPPRTLRDVDARPLVASITTSTRSTTTATANGPDRPICARATRNSPSAALETASHSGFDRTGFFEGRHWRQPSWTVQPRNPPKAAPQQPLQSRVPVVPAAASRRPPAQSPEARTDATPRRTKILATLGPASSDRNVIADLFRAGADVFRINMSHTSHERHARAGGADPSGRVRVRAADRHPGRPARTEAAGRALRRRSDHARQGRHVLSRRRRQPGDATRVHLPHAEIFAAIHPAIHCCSTMARCGSPPPEVERSASPPRVRGRRQAVGPQGREPAATTLGSRRRPKGSLALGPSTPATRRQRR